ncbi:hypothetical protein SPSYN_03102 [Sporotomaculum syntrophicum]|uniref:Uncharacterized protein n=1 Tax=Sporotomaculum syntrophicum TaxID=182264 RepID=A0A9D2WM62_9FIRM|nr:hypothetical protein [Sporotomaculum syntrophicum]KAF1083753.1 hypothetical protein SPSYN_03102 [Sporotomaculum syntrophicum]
MTALLKYEYKKLKKNVLWSLITILIFATFFLVTGYFSGQRINWEMPLLLQILGIVSFIGLAILMILTFVAPFISSLTLFYHDLNDKHAVFEAYIPEPGWKRLLAKYIVYFLYILAGISLSGALAFLTFTVIKMAAPPNVQFHLDSNLKYILESPEMASGLFLEIAKYILNSAVGFMPIIVFVNFFFTLYAVIRHKIKGAVPVTFLTGAVAGISLSWLFDMLFAEQVGWFTGSILGLDPEMIFTFILCAIAFIWIARMLDTKTELK